MEVEYNFGKERLGIWCQDETTYPAESKNLTCQVCQERCDNLCDEKFYTCDEVCDWDLCYKCATCNKDDMGDENTPQHIMHIQYTKPGDNAIFN